MSKLNISNNTVKSVLSEAAKEVVARKRINNIREKLIHENRFFADKSFLLALEKLFEQSTTVIKKGTLFYRARIYKEPDKPQKQLGIFEESDYEGYDEKGSFINLTSEWPIYGRMHPSGVRVLYTSSDSKTAAKELNPSVDELVSIAIIINDYDLRIADLSNTKFPNEYLDEDYEIKYILELLSQGYSEREYVFSQYVAAYCANQGFDGIGYRSKYSRKSDTNKDNGVNYTIFNYQKCHPISSKLYSIKNTSLQLNQIEPKLTHELINTKLNDINMLF